MKYKMKLLVLSMFFILVNNKYKTIDKDMQSEIGNDIEVDFTFVNIDNPNELKSFTLERNTLLIELYSLKLLYTPLQKFTNIRMNDIIIFDNFEVIFDLNLINRQIFNIADKERENTVNMIIDKLRTRYNQGAENCRFILSNNIFDTPVDMNEKALASIHNSNDMNNYLSVSTNIFCFRSMDRAISFNSNFLKMYNHFILSSQANNLFYYNKMKINKLKVVYRTILQHQQNDPILGEVINDSIVTDLKIKYAILIFSKDGVLLSDSPGNNFNILYSFNYDNIKDCHIEIIDKKYVLPKGFMPNSNKCCIKFIVDVKDVFDNVLNICSYQTSDYQCNIETKFIQENLINKCVKKLSFNLDFAFNNNINIREYVMNFSSFSQKFIFDRIYDFIMRKLNEIKLLPIEKQKIVESKIMRIIQDLGNEFDMYLKQNNQSELLRRLKVIVVPPAPFISTPLPPIPNANNIIEVPPIPSNVIVETPGLIPKNVYKLCETHPKMKLCICAAYPLSQICDHNYCLNHPNFYECSPRYCDSHSNDLEACKCKFKPFDLECQCKIDPLKKECYCIKYPTSAYCLPDYCLKLNNNNQIFCLCKNNPLAAECNPSYCHENKFDNRCKCLLNPLDKECSCILNPSDDKCKYKQEDTSDEYDQGVGLIKQYQKPNSKKENKDDSCVKDDIYCLCKNHPSYKECVCVAYPKADICVDNYCENENNSGKYKCNPNKDCSNDEDCKCKKNFDECKCELSPYDKDCFCKKWEKSHFCNMKNCSFEKDNIYCLCEEDPKNIACDVSAYCHKNLRKKECYCLINPTDKFCKCLNSPDKCSKNDIMKSLNDFNKNESKEDENMEKKDSHEKVSDDKQIEINDTKDKNLKNSKNKKDSNDKPERNNKKSDLIKEKNNNSTEISNDEDSIQNNDDDHLDEFSSDNSLEGKNLTNEKNFKNHSKNSDQFKYVLTLFNKQLLFNKKMHSQLNLK